MNGTIIHPLAGLGPIRLWSHPLVGGERLAPSDPFGSRRGSHTHGGIDFSGRGMTVLAPAAGRVIRTGFWREDTGNVVAIEQQTPAAVHELLHLATVKVAVGDIVQAGQVVGVSGNTGTRETSRGRLPVAWHLHWQVRAQLPPEAASLMEQIRQLPPGFSGHPSILHDINSFLSGGPLAPLDARLRRLQSDGPVALGGY